MFAESTFRVIPDKPNAGSTIRVTGEQFAASQKFNFYIDTEKIGNFVTDSSGHFITTMQIPNIEKESRVDFKIIGHDEIEKKISLKLGGKENRIIVNENVRLEVRGIPNIVYQGDKLELEGTGTPGKTIIIEIINPEKTIINSRIVTVENTGTWKLLEPISIPLSAQFGEYSASVSDGRNEILKKWTVKTNKVIIISPEKIQFDAGELIKFTGTAMPNIPIELILENNVGDEIASDIIEVADSGLVEFEYQTTENDDIEGTWTLIATQKNNKEFVYVGYDVFPTIPVNIKFDKTNYKNTEKPIISLAGIPSEKVSLIIITPSGNVIGSDTTIQLKADGRGQHSLDLSGYVSGIYTAVVKKGGSQNSENFSVGLQSGSGQISSKITQTEYSQGERILLLGSTTNPNSLMTVTLINPDGIEVKTLEIASNAEGMFSEEKLKIPSDGKIGIWQIEVVSGSNKDKIEFSVFSSTEEGISIKITEKVQQGSLLEMYITASKKTSIIIQIIDTDGEQVQELTCITTKEFKCESFWSTPKDAIPGIYTVKVFDTTASAEATFQIIKK